MSRPVRTAVSGQSDDRACRALLHSFHDPVVDPVHDLVEVLLRRDRALVNRVRLDLGQQLVELLLHFRRRLFTALNHLLRVRPDLLHLLENRDSIAVAVERFARPLHRLIFGALPNHATKLARLILKHFLSCCRSHSRDAKTNRSRPASSSRTPTLVYPPCFIISSAASEARRSSTSSASKPPRYRYFTALRTIPAVAAIPSCPLNRASGGSQSRA